MKTDLRSPWRFKWLVGLVGAGLLVVLAGWLAATSAAPRINSDLAAPPHEIIPGGGLYSLGSDRSYGNTAAYALATSGGIIVIDPGLRFGALQSAFNDLGLNLAEVKIVLVTHRHADHWFAAR